MKSMAIYDTSGIESMAPSSVSERDEAARAAIFQKARMLSYGGCASSSSSSGRKNSHRQHHDFSSLSYVGCCCNICRSFLNLSMLFLIFIFQRQSFFIFYFTNFCTTFCLGVHVEEWILCS